MPTFVHTCVRVRDPEASERFYGLLGFERRGRLNFQTAYNIYMGLPGDGDTLELDIYHGRLEGLLTAEVEFASVSAASAFVPPDWLGPDVTDDPRYKNKKLATDGLPS